MLEYRTMITDDELRHLCDVDGVNRVAIAATHQADDEESIIAVARYGLVSSDQSDAAESAVVVEDAFQGRGLGKIMVARLVLYAREHGVRRFVATIHANNAQILRFIEHSGFRVERQMDRGVWDFTIYLDPPSTRLN
jgi:RimJ/RimL family protein N-acetyltransferase